MSSWRVRLKTRVLGDTLCFLRRNTIYDGLSPCQKRKDPAVARPFLKRRGDNALFLIILLVKQTVGRCRSRDPMDCDPPGSTGSADDLLLPIDPIAPPTPASLGLSFRRPSCTPSPSWIKQLQDNIRIPSLKAKTRRFGGFPRLRTAKVDMGGITEYCSLFPTAKKRERGNEIEQ